MTNSNKKKESLFRINSVIILKKNNTVFLKFDTQVVWKELYIILKHYVKKLNWLLKNFEFPSCDLNLEITIKEVEPRKLNIKSFELFRIDISKITNLHFFNDNQINQEICLGIKINYDFIPENDFLEENEISILFSKIYKEKGSQNLNDNKRHAKLYGHTGDKIKKYFKNSSDFNNL